MPIYITRVATITAQYAVNNSRGGAINNTLFLPHDLPRVASFGVRPLGSTEPRTMATFTSHTVATGSQPAARIARSRRRPNKYFKLNFLIIKSFIINNSSTIKKAEVLLITSSKDKVIYFFSTNKPVKGYIFRRYYYIIILILFILLEILYNLYFNIDYIISLIN